MEKIKKAGIIFIVYCILLASAVGFWEYKARKYFFEPETVIKIVKESKPIYKYIKKPKTVKEYKDCCESQIEIETRMRHNIMYITARDNWKMTEKKLKLDYKQKRNWKPVIVVSGIAFTVGAVVAGLAISRIMRKL
jgi:hypothetical protein